MILWVRTIVLILCKTLSFNFLDFLNSVKVDTFSIINPTCWISHCNYLSTKLCSLFCCVDSNITCTWYANSSTLDVLAVIIKHSLCKIKKAITCSLCSCEWTAPVETLTCKNAFIYISDSLILTEHITDLTSTCTDITGRNICVSTDVLTKLCHKALAECHNFSVALALRIKVRATLTAADRKTCKWVLENLLETEKLNNAEVYWRMKS